MRMAFLFRDETTAWWKANPSMGARHIADARMAASLGLAGQLVEGNSGHVEVFSGAEQPFDHFTDLEGCLAGDAPRPATAAEHRIDVIHVSVKTTAFEMQGGPATAHRGSAFRTSPAVYVLGFFRIWLLIHWSR